MRIARLLPAFVLAAAIPAFWGAPRSAPEPVFQTFDRCFACHNGISAASGEDVSIGFAWRASMMANAARDPYWQAGVRRETLDHPSASAAIEAECSLCHMPMANYEARLAGRQGQVFAHLPVNAGDRASALAADGVSCSLCHQISSEKLGTRESLVGRFVIEKAGAGGERLAYGPFEVDAGRTRIMRSASGFRPAEGKHIQRSEMCATCHTLITHSLGPDGKPAGELPEQMPYQEWLHSQYRETRSCQDCHMPAVKEPVAVSAVLGEPREGVSRHVFVGGNFFMQRLLNRFRDELGVVALPQELESQAMKTIAHLQTEAAEVAIGSVEARPDRLEIDVTVRNLAGHKLPTAYPSRRVWLHVAVRDGGGRTIFESGALSPGGSIQGNDNDADAARFEPHYTRISEAGQVQIYENIMADTKGAVTTGLLRGVRYLKDNRIPPEGFDKRTADQEVAVVGAAFEDPDFTGGRDTVRYSIATRGARGPFRVEAELWYQSIGFRWAENLRRYDSPETRNFSRYFDAVKAASGAVLARARADH